MTFYLIPGLGANERVFKNLALQPHEVIILHWIEPKEKESLKEYSLRMAAEQIDFSKEVVLVGLSMGGFIAKEIAQHHQVKKTIILSSIQLSTQFSIAIKLARMIPVHKFISIGALKWLNHLTANYFFSVKDDISKKALHKTIDETDSKFLSWAIEAILKWKNHTYLEEIVHIHGNKDRIFPLNYINTPYHLIEGGGHWMVVEKGKEISEIILQQTLK